MVKYYKKFYDEVSKYAEGIHVLREGAAEETIEEFEKQYDMRLPANYRKWLLLNNGGELFAVPAGTILYGVREKTGDKENIFCIENNFRSQYRAGLPSYLFAIAEENTGDIIGFDLRRTNLRDGVIVIWNHETGEFEDEWRNFGKWLEAEMEIGSMMVNYDGSDKDIL